MGLVVHRIQSSKRSSPRFLGSVGICSKAQHIRTSHRIMSRRHGCCFKPLSFGVVCLAAKLIHMGNSHFHSNFIDYVLGTCHEPGAGLDVGENRVDTQILPPGNSEYWERETWNNTLTTNVLFTDGVKSSEETLIEGCNKGDGIRAGGLMRKWHSGWDLKADKFSTAIEEGSSVPESGNGTCKGPGDSRDFSLFYLAEVSFISNLGQLEFPKPSTKIALVESERK